MLKASTVEMIVAAAALRVVQIEAEEQLQMLVRSADRGDRAHAADREQVERRRSKDMRRPAPVAPCGAGARPAAPRSSESAGSSRTK